MLTRSTESLVAMNRIGNSFYVRLLPRPPITLVRDVSDRVGLPNEARMKIRLLDSRLRRRLR